MECVGDIDPELSMIAGQGKSHQETLINSQRSEAVLKNRHWVTCGVELCFSGSVVVCQREREADRVATKGL